MATTNYRDIGTLNGTITELLVDTTNYTQVYRATHKGENPLPFMNRSFISFSYGGKNIEDFNLIATVAGDRMELNGYANFDDLTSSYDVINGQFFWGSYYRTHELTFNLSTDEMSQRTLDEFLYWFSAGKIRELILAEHPNRAIMARVAEPPHLAVLPFEKKIQVPIGGHRYNTSTTVFKGTISLRLVMDEPHWYSKLNIFGKLDDLGVYRDTWYDVTEGRERSVLDIPDALKIVYEDGIPLSSMISNTMLLGNNIFATVALEVFSSIIRAITETEYLENSEVFGYYNNGDVYNLSEGTYYAGAVIFDETTLLGARVSGATMSEETGVSSLGPFNDGASTISFYYAGTAPSPLLLKFKLYPKIDIESGYICSPANTYASSINRPGPYGLVTIPYNTITMECTTKKEFNFTTPNILTSFNLVIKIFSANSDGGMIKVGLDWANVRETIRASIWHSAVRAWANRVIDMFDTEESDGVITNDISPAQLKIMMSYLLKNENGQMFPMYFSFDSKTGEATAEILYRNCLNLNTQIIETLPENLVDFADYCSDKITTVKENVGDMVKSKYLIIDERNYPTSSGTIIGWESGSTYAHRLYHNVETGLFNLYVNYLNMYL